MYFAHNHFEYRAIKLETSDEVFQEVFTKKMYSNKVHLVSISPNFMNIFFCAKVKCIAFLYFQFKFNCFCARKLESCS